MIMRGNGVIKATVRFIKSSVLTGFNNVSSKIMTQNILCCIGMAKEDTFTRIIAKFVRMASASRKGTDLTTKSAKELEVRNVSRANGSRSLSCIAMWSDVPKAEMMVESMQPKFRRKSRARIHGTHGITNRVMRMFTRSIGMRRHWGFGFIG